MKESNFKYLENEFSILYNIGLAAEYNLYLFQRILEILNRVESLLAKADAIEAQYTQLKTKIENLPQAILAKAFKGELVEQLESDGDAKELLKEIEVLRGELESSKKSKGRR